MTRMVGLNVIQFQGVHSKDIPIVEDQFLVQILLFAIVNVDVNNIDELAQQSVQNHGNIVTLSR